MVDKMTAPIASIIKITINYGTHWFVLLIAGLFIYSSVLADVPGVYADRIVFGQTAVLSGPEGGRGESIRRGILAAFKEVNREGGINGRQLELMSKDDRYNPRIAVNNIQPWLESGEILALLGCTGTGVAKFAVPVAANAGIPYIAPLTGATFIRNRDNFPNVVNLRASYVQETEAWIRYLEDLGIKRVAVFFQDDVFGRAGATAVREALAKRGLLIVARGSYARGLTAVSSAVFDIRKASPEAVVMIGTNRPIAAFIRHLRSLDVDPIFINVSIVGNQALLEDLGEMAEGIIVSQPFPSPWQKDPAPIVKDFLQAMTFVTDEDAHDVLYLKEFEYWVHEPTRELNYVNYLALEGYTTGRFVIEALKRIDGEPNPAALLHAMFESGPFDLGGFTVEFQPGSNQGSHEVYLTVLSEEEKSQLIYKTRVEDHL